MTSRSYRWCCLCSYSSNVYTIKRYCCRIITACISGCYFINCSWFDRSIFRTKYIVIAYSGNYGEVYNDLYKDDSSLGSFSIKNGTKVIWINLDEHHSHTMNLFEKNYKNLLLTAMIPFGGTAEYTFKSVGQYQFFDPQNRVSTGTIVVN